MPPNTDLALSYIQELIKCSCSSDPLCVSANCGCKKAGMPCSVFCACKITDCCSTEHKHIEMMMMMALEVKMKMMITKLHILICIYNTFLAIFTDFGKTPVKKNKTKCSMVAKCHRARLKVSVGLNTARQGQRSNWLD